jgi:hypothetical protein
VPRRCQVPHTFFRQAAATIQVPTRVDRVSTRALPTPGQVLHTFPRRAAWQHQRTASVHEGSPASTRCKVQSTRVSLRPAVVLPHMPMASPSARFRLQLPATYPALGKLHSAKSIAPAQRQLPAAPTQAASHAASIDTSSMVATGCSNPVPGAYAASIDTQQCYSSND